MDIKNDKILDVALGNSRWTKTWKNKQVHWSGLLDRMATPTRTSETVAEYKAMGKGQQSGIKDVGGFVGGYCNSGSRSDIRFRSVLCLDADFATSELWDDWVLMYGNAAAVYSTHKHTPEKPRLRLVVPLARNVTPDEYPAIGRRVAAVLGIDQFDDTSYQPQRMMYWPSVSQDGEYIFRYLDGPLLDPDAVLATYHDWRDVSAWPMSSRVAEVIKKAAATQQDPLTKGGIVGAFCRSYSIEEAIAEFVPVYAPCGEGRYTYTEGSTAGGVVLYDGKFSYSHHATDPASMQLCNAWDLVRLHKFAALDADCEPGAPASSRPSYKAMSELAAADERVKAQIVADRLAEAGEDFSAPLPDENWQAKLKVTEKGGIASTIENVVVILNGDPALSGCVGCNEMTHNIVAVRSLPWRSVVRESQWSDADDAELRYYMERKYGVTGKDKIFDGLNVVAGAHRFHPVRDYLDSCEWDGVPRVETLLVDYLGAEDTPYTRAVTRKALVAAVARIYRPGCKFDYMLTLRGRQGLGKSALIAKLGGEWFSDSFTTMQGKDAYEQVLGVWMMEVGELAGMRKAEAETIKLYISKQVDRFRPAYGRRLQEFPRQCVFIGTTNETQFLRDTTGNRRFWVVDTPNAPRLSIWDDLTPEVVRLIWGEAVQLYQKGEDLFLPPELEAAAREVQETYEEENPKVGIVAQYLERLLPANWDTLDLYARRQWLEGSEQGTVPRSTVCSLEIWAEALGQSPDRMDRYASKEVRDIMVKIPQWRHQGNAKITAGPYGRQRYYRKEGV
ncbi:MAG: VapE domain-containing protein [Faecousia sp.]